MQAAFVGAAGRDGVADLDLEMASAAPGRVVAAVAVMGGAVAMAVLPVVVALGLLRGAGPLAVALASVAAALAFGKAAVMACGVAARVWAWRAVPVGVTSTD